MTGPALAILSEMRRRGVEIAAHGDLLRFRPVAKMTAKLLNAVRANKAGIIAVLAISANSAGIEATESPSVDDLPAGHIKPHREWERFKTVAVETPHGWTDPGAWPNGRPCWIDAIQHSDDDQPQENQPGPVDSMPDELRSYVRPDDSGSPQRRRHLAFIRFCAEHPGDYKAIERVRPGIVIGASRTRRVDKGGEIISELC